MQKPRTKRGHQCPETESNCRHEDFQSRSLGPQVLEIMSFQSGEYVDCSACVAATVTVVGSLRDHAPGAGNAARVVAS
jgi:hypothetical protein